MVKTLHVSNKQEKTLCHANSKLGDVYLLVCAVVRAAVCQVCVISYGAASHQSEKKKASLN